jgi:hypothetical protein
MLHLYNVDWRDSRRYDITFNIDRLTSAHVVDILLELTKRPEFTLTEDKVGAFNDFLIKTRVYALLANSLFGPLSRISVSVENGVVKLDGMLTSSEQYVDEMVEQVTGLEGVKGVDNKIIPGLASQDWNV